MAPGVYWIKMSRKMTQPLVHLGNARRSVVSAAGLCGHHINVLVPSQSVTSRQRARADRHRDLVFLPNLNQLKPAKYARVATCTDLLDSSGQH
jgi:hypothetical protein